MHTMEYGLKIRRTAAFLAALNLVVAGACAGPESSDPHASPAPHAGRPYVVMVSFDGVHPDFLVGAHTPHFDRIAAEGVTAAGLIPAYPSKTFPNHYTIATGLYPYRHGLVDNTFYDAELDAMFRINDRTVVEDARFYGGEPIWVTAERQGVTTASYFWVGTEAPILGRHPTYFKLYDHLFPHAERVDTVLHWLSLPEPERPNLVMLYFAEPDGTAHDEGPHGEAVAHIMEEMDGLLGRLLDGLAALPMADRVHVVVVSDHGMEEVPAGHVIYLADLVDLEGVRVAYNVTQALLYFEGDDRRQQQVFEQLQQQLENASVFRRHETPERWRYRDNPRIGDLVVVTEPGWIIRRRGGSGWAGGGMHGWDPLLPAMHGIFMARGPGLRERVTVPAFESIHVHPLVAHLLGIDPAPGIDGRIDAVADLLASSPTSP
jgi:predicted AlkP superfamily pyrophosphatase or phosphodiesterase